MNSSRALRRGLISLFAFGYYWAVVHMTGLSIRLTTMGQFFGHVLIYGAAVALFAMLIFAFEQSRAKEKTKELAAGAARVP